VSSFQTYFLKRLTNFYETWYQHHAEGHNNAVLCAVLSYLCYDERANWKALSGPALQTLYFGVLRRCMVINLQQYVYATVVQ